MVSFDVVSLLTKFLDENSLTLHIQHFNKEILSFYKYVLTSTYFCVHSQFYDQTALVAMGFPHIPVTANFYMHDFLTKEIEKPHTSIPAGIDIWTKHSSSVHMDKKN